MKRALIISFLVLFAFLPSACTQTVVREEGEEKGKIDLKLQQMKGKSAGNSEIFAVKGTNGADEGFIRLIELMGRQGQYFYKTDSKPEGLIGKADVVLLKFNCQWSQRGGTNTDLIKSVVEAVTKHPDGFEGEIIIADNGQSQYGPTGKGGSIEWAENNALNTSQSVKKVAEMFASDYKVSAMVWDKMTEKEVKEYLEEDYEDGFILSREEASPGVRISYPKFRTQYGTYVSFKEGIWNENKREYDSDRLKIVNMPVLKSHLNYYVTACIKNYMGTTSDKLTRHGAHISVGLGGMGSQMAGTRMPVLNIIDAIWINPHPEKGPFTDYESAVEVNIIAASTDPGALDYWAAKHILMEAARKLNLNNYETMDPESRQPGTFGYWLDKSVEELQKSGFESTIDKDKINVYIDYM